MMRLATQQIFTLLTLLSASQSFAESRALLIGVGKHQHLSPVFMLEGCENDVLSMANVVAKLGQGQVKTTTLVDQRATKSAILGSLKQIERESKPTDRFIFYFSGHGTLDKDRDIMALVPFDAKQGQSGTWIRREELHAALSAIKGSKVAILDACHSGGLVGKDVDPLFRSRFVDLSAPSLSKGPGASWRVPPAVVEEAEEYQDSTEVQYLMACTVDQQAWEFKRAPSTGKPSGVFTYHLLQQLENPESQKKTWGVLMGDVAAGVQNSLAKHDKIQNPIASAAATAAPVAGGSAPSVTRPTDPKTLQELFLRSQPNRSMLRVNLPNGANQLPIEGRMPISIRVEQKGFLIMLVSHGEEVAMIFPQPQRGQDLFNGFISQKGDFDKLSLIGRRPGSYQVKAFLFPASGAQDPVAVKSAQQVYDAFKNGRKVTDQSKSGLDVSVEDYVTFEWTIEVAEVLFGDRSINPTGIAEFQKWVASPESGLGQYLVRIASAAGLERQLESVDESSLIRFFNVLATNAVPLLDEPLAGSRKIDRTILAPLRDKNGSPTPEQRMNFLAALMPELFQTSGGARR